MKLLALCSLLIALSAFRPVEWIVAVVDAEIVTFTEFVDEFRLAAARTGRGIETMAAREKSILAEQVLDRLITDALLLQEARRRGITVTPAEADAAARETLDRMRAQFVDQNTYERALAAEFTTPEKLRARYRKQAEGQLFRNKLIDREVRREIKLTDSDVFDAYQKRAEEIHVRHILVNDSVLAEKVRERLVDRENFDAVAQSITAIEAADLGWVKRGSLVEAFEAAAFGLREGETSKVVKTRYGYHVIQMIERRTVPLPPLTDELKERIFNELYAARFDKKIEAFVANLRSKAYVEFRKNSLDPLY